MSAVCVFILQNLRDALDSIYDAKVPPTWKKVTSMIIYASC